MEDMKSAREVRWRKLPFGAILLEKCRACSYRASVCHKALVFILMSFGYASYVIARRPISVVKAILCPVCADSLGCNGSANSSYDANFTAEDFGWAPFNDADRGRSLLGSLDLAFLFAYAVGHFFSGWVAERVSLRYFLTFGMIATGANAIMIGVAYFADIHHIAYFIVFQILGGLAQSTGWPGSVAVMTTWFGKANRGLVFGAYSICQSGGSLLGVLIPSLWAGELTSPWGWAFIVPGLIPVTMGVLVWLFLVEDPTHAGFAPPLQQLKEDLPKAKSPSESRTEAVNVLYPVFRHGSSSSECGDGQISSSKDVCGDDSKNGEDSTSSDFTLVEKDSTKLKFHSLLQRKPSDRKSNDIRSCDNDPKSCDCDTESGSLSIKSHDMTSDTKHVSSDSSVSSKTTDPKAINFFRALLIPGVVEYSFAFFFIKTVSYTFLFWLPFYVKTSHPQLSAKTAGWLSILYDFGGIVAVVIGGVLSDRIRSRAVVVVSSLLLAIPTMFSLNAFGGVHLALYSVLLVLCGAFIVTPYTMVSTTVSGDLGTHKSLKNNQSAKATVGAIVNGIGSFGSALGPLIIGIITDQIACDDNQNWTGAFYLLMASCLVAAVLLSRLLVMDGRKLVKRLKRSLCKRRSSEAVFTSQDEEEEEEEEEGRLDEGMRKYMQIMFMETAV